MYLLTALFVVACGEVFACCTAFLVFVWDLVALRLLGGELPMAPVVSVPLGDIPLSKNTFMITFWL